MIRNLIQRIIKPRYIYRSAVDGRFVSRWYAWRNPATTYKAKVR